jgi:glycosyltransferase involved in cell wall biosynthesis
MRVLHVAQPEHSGVPNTVASMARAQLAAGLEVAVACPPASVLWRELGASGARLARWDATREPGPALAREVTTLGRLVRQAAPDLVHLHAAKAGLAGRLVVRGRIPTVYQPHAWSFEAAEGPLRVAVIRWERFAGARWTDRVLCVSEDERRRGEKAGIGAQTVVIPNGVDLARHAPRDSAESRRQLGLPDGPLVVCVARLARQKGVDVLLDAWPRVHAPGARLVIVGDGPEGEKLRARDVRGVHWAGARDDVPTWLAAADVVAVPSRWEGAALVVLEAMASARSVVATDVGGARQMLAPPAAGEVVAVGDADALARALEDRLQDPERARREGLAGRARANEHYDVAASNRRIVDLYSAVRSGPHPTQQPGRSGR